MKPTSQPTGSAADIASSLDLSPDPTFLRRAEVLRSQEAPTIANQIRVALRLLSAARRRRALIMFSAWGRCKPDLVVAALLGLLPRRRRPPVVMVSEVWQPTPGWQNWAEQAVVRAADRGINHYVTTGPSEVPLLADIWGIDREKVTSCRFPFVPGHYRLADSRLPRGDYVFAGGDSLRDWPTLLQVARDRPETRFVIATMLLDPAEVPANVEVHRVRIKGYADLMREAGVVVVPIAPRIRRGVGALTFMMAMWLRKPVVLTDSDYSRNYLADGVNGLLVDGTPAGYDTAIRWALDPANDAAVSRLGAAAHEYVERHCTLSGYVGAIIGELDHVIQRRTDAQSRPRLHRAA